MVKRRVIMTEIKEIEIEKINVDKNMRETLGDLEYLKNTVQQRIKSGEKPLASPIKVKSRNGEYELIYGERRITALQELGLDKVEAIIEEDTMDANRERYQENKARKQWEWYEEARYFKRLSDEGKTQREIGDVSGYSHQTISDFLVALDVSIKIPPGRNLERRTIREVAFAPEKDWEIIIEKIIEGNMSKEKTRNLVKKVKDIIAEVEKIEDEDVRESVGEQIEPIIYEDEMTLDVAKDIIRKARGTYVGTPEVLRAMTKIRPFLLKYTERFPEKMVIKDWEEDGTIFYQFTASYPKKILEASEKQ